MAWKRFYIVAKKKKKITRIIIDNKKRNGNQYKRLHLNGTTNKITGFETAINSILNTG